MKKSKKVWLIVGIGVFAIVLAVLFSTYSGQAGEREQLENNLFTVSDILDFADALRAGADFQLPWSAEVTAVKINYSGEGDSATINLDIYAYKGE